MVTDFLPAVGERRGGLEVVYPVRCNFDVFERQAMTERWKRRLREMSAALVRSGLNVLTNENPPPGDLVM